MTTTVSITRPVFWGGCLVMLAIAYGAVKSRSETAAVSDTWDTESMRY